MNPEELKLSIEKNGFAIAPEVLCEAEIHRVAAAIDQALQAQSTLKAERERRSDFALRNALAISEVREIVEGGPVAALMRQLMGAKARSVRAIVFDKTPHANWKVPWHQDLTIAVQSRAEVMGFAPWSMKEGVPHVQPPLEILASMLTIRLHLDDCGLDNGALRVLPASHREGRLEAAEISRRRQNTEEISCPVERGGALLMKPLLLHASSASQNPRRRRVLHLEWAAADLPAPLRWFNWK